MANSPAMIFKDLLVAAGVGTFAATTGVGIFIGVVPNKPDEAVTCIDTGGRSPNPKFRLDYPSVQVIVRGDQGGYSDAYTRALAVQNALIGLPSQDIGSDRWVSVAMSGGINFVGNDENKRPMFTLNFAIIMEPNSGTYREEV